MKIYIDADACPKHIKEILLKASIRTSCPLVFVANQPLNIIKNALIQCIHVQQGFDVADNYIVEKIEKDELAITADIPLAAQIVEKGALALNPRGHLYSQDTIRQRLAIRNLMDEVRSSGIHTGGPKAIDKTDIQRFSNALDRYLTKHKK
jgi:uncharacterized protein YaiI (UPF0178 family)